MTWQSLESMGVVKNAAHRCGLLRLLPYGLPRNDARGGEGSSQ